MENISQVLVVEDDSEQVEAYNQAAQAYSHIKLKFVADEPTAMNLVGTTRFDTIVCDLKLKFGSGMKVVHEARDKPFNRSTPIYVVSGYLDPMVRKIAENFHVMDTIEKPLDCINFVSDLAKRLRTKKVVFSYDAQLINLMINSGLGTFKHYFKKRPYVGRIRLKDNNTPARGIVTSIIEFQSTSGKGSVALSANAQFIKNIANILFKHDAPTINAKVAADIMGEMTNQVIGRIKNEILKRGTGFEIGLPNVMVKKQLVDYHHTKKPIVFVPFGLDNYGCDLEFSVKDGTIKLGEVVKDKPKEVQDSGSVILFD